MRQLLEDIDTQHILPDAMKHAAERETAYRDKIMREIKAMRTRQYIQIGIVLVLFCVIFYFHCVKH
jgi:t-SNARE complex subunit (syntaxin)